MNRAYTSKSLILISFLYSFNENENYRIGHYSNNAGIFESENLELTLKEDKTYLLSYSGCKKTNDSGLFNFKKDTLILSSKSNQNYILNCLDTNYSKKNIYLIIDSGRLYFLYSQYLNNNTYYLTKQGLFAEKHKILDKNGDGYARFVDSNHYPIEEGYYQNYKLINGEVNSTKSYNDTTNLGYGLEIRYHVEHSKITIINGKGYPK
jgi:hypothetical protein